MKYTDLVSIVSRELDIPEEVVEKAYKSYWIFIKETIQSLPLKGDINEEEFSKLRTNFNIPSLGKLCLTYDRFLGIKKRFNYIKNIKNNVENKED